MEFKRHLTFRNLFILNLLACIFILASSHFIESVLYIIPCQLCILQRIIYYSLAILFLIGIIHHPKNIGRYIYSIASLIITSCGLIIAGRQIWIQHLPIEKVPECAPGLERLLQLHPLLDVIKIIFQGTSECFQIHFTILGLPLSNWSFISFLGFFCMMIFILCCQKKRWI
jgi:disulfide bond formation protein DsbB